MPTRVRRYFDARIRVSVPPIFLPGAGRQIAEHPPAEGWARPLANPLRVTLSNSY
jgi:hypothetical protein